jgi:hypothetical protein
MTTAPALACLVALLLAGEPRAPAPPVSLEPSFFISRAELLELPMAGPAWSALLADAGRSLVGLDLADQDDDRDSLAFAAGLVAARHEAAGSSDLAEPYRARVQAACLAAMETENGGRTLALGRNLTCVVLAADLIAWSPPEAEAPFRAWVDGVRRETLDGRTLVSCHEDRTNNWGTHAGAARLAAAMYLRDRVEFDRAARVFCGWLGHRAVYAGFDWGELDWQADPARPVGINPRGATREGHSIDGVLPDDQRRSGGFTWPPPQENYAYEALQGALTQAIFLDRAGVARIWTTRSNALLRAFRWLHEHANFPATGDDEWQPWIVNEKYGTSFPAPAQCGHGKALGYSDWLTSGTSWP